MCNSFGLFYLPRKEYSYAICLTKRFFQQESSTFAISTTKSSRIVSMNVKAFYIVAHAQFFINVRTPESFGTLLTWLMAAVTKDKCEGLWQVQYSPNSQDQSQVCHTDTYLVRFLVNFTGFCRYTRILQLCSAKYHKPWV